MTDDSCWLSVTHGCPALQVTPSGERQHTHPPVNITNTPRGSPLLYPKWQRIQLQYSPDPPPPPAPSTLTLPSQLSHPKHWVTCAPEHFLLYWTFSLFFHFPSWTDSTRHFTTDSLYFPTCFGIWSEEIRTNAEKRHDETNRGGMYGKGTARHREASSGVETQHESRLTAYVKEHQVFFTSYLAFIHKWIKIEENTEEKY